MSEATADNLSDDSSADDGGATGADPVKPALSIVDGDNEGTTPVAAPADWPEDWREKLAGNDEAAKKRLGRFSSPANIFKSLLNAEKKLSTSRPIAALSENPTEEELVAYRAANGIPETPDKYDTDLGDGLVLGEEDKPVADSFLSAAHKGNLPPAAVKVALKWYYDFQESERAAQQAADTAQRDEGVQMLRSEYGQEFSPNMNAVRGWFDAVDPGEKKADGTVVRSSMFDRMFSARLADGSKLGNNPDMIKFFVDAARQANPAAALIPGNLHNSLVGIDDRIGQIEKVLRSDRKAYDKDTKMQEEYRMLLGKREELKGRGA